MAKTLTEVKAKYLADAKGRPCGQWIVKDPSTGNVVANSAAKFRHSFDGGTSWVEAQQRTTDLYRSADGKYYEESTLPEQTDEFCTERTPRKCAQSATPESLTLISMRNCQTSQFLRLQRANEKRSQTRSASPC